MKVGVIGGNGVAATNRLLDMVERKVTAAGAFRDAHHPEMIVWQATSAPSRSMFLEGRGADWRPDYIRIATDFRTLGCDIGCMCCNTAHYAVNEISERAGLPFINLLEVVAAKCQTLGHERYELFCSDGARKFDIYGAAFRKVCPDVEMTYPSEERQAMVTKSICAVKTSDRFSGVARRMLDELIEGAKCPVIFGCTDLRVAYCYSDVLPSQVAVDSLECLADEIVLRTRKQVNL